MVNILGMGKDIPNYMEFDALTITDISSFSHIVGGKNQRVTSNVT